MKNDKTKGQNERKRDKEGEHGERQKRRGKTKKEKKGKEKRKRKRKPAKGCPGGTILITWVSTGETHHDDDGHTQASACWADRLLPPASPLSSRACVLAPPVRVAVTTVLCRSAVASLSSLCHFRMKTSVPSSTRRNHLPTFCAASRQPPFELDAERLKVLLKVLYPVPLLYPGVAITPEHLPKHNPPRQAFFAHVRHEAREQYTRLRTVVLTLSESVLRSALA